MTGSLHRGITATAVLLLALLLGPEPGDGQLVTDRPNVVESSAAVGPGVFQVEAGVALTRASDADTWNTPLLLRVGVMEKLELRVETGALTRIGDPVDETGFADVALGAKWAFRDGAGGGPGLAALLHLDLPVGSASLSQDGVRPSLRGVAEWGLGDGWGLGVLGGVRLDRSGPDRFTSGILAAALSRAVGEGASVYGEVAATQIAGDEYGGTVPLLNLGGVYLLSDDSQLDAQLGVGLSDRAPDLGITAGFSRRIGGR